MTDFQQRIVDAVRAVPIKYEIAHIEPVSIEEATTIARAVLAAVKPELNRLADYENRSTWGTTCGSCARILDSSIHETERRQRAENALTRVREIASDLFMAGRTKVERDIARRLHAALDQPAPTAATRATHHQEQ